VIAVITLGTSAHRLGLASVVAAIAVILVGAVGALVSKQLSKVPENAMKMGWGSCSRVTGRSGREKA